MGNAISPSCLQISNPSIKLFLQDGNSKTLKGKRLAGEIMFEFPECMVSHQDGSSTEIQGVRNYFKIDFRSLFETTLKDVHANTLAQGVSAPVCHADSFFIGKSIPALAFDSRLINGETYMVLPLDCFRSSRPLSASAFAAFAASCSKGGVINLKNNQPFEYLKGTDGKVQIKVTPKFVVKLVSREVNTEEKSSGGKVMLCSTPELKKQYDDLVGSKEQVWSPKLDTISEAKGRLSPWRQWRI